MDLLGIFSSLDIDPKRRRIEEVDYKKFKSVFMQAREKIFTKLGNEQGRKTLQENFELFGQEGSIPIIRESNLPESDVVRLGIPLCEGLGISASEVYLELAVCCIDEIVEAMYEGAPENHARLADLMSYLDDFIDTRFFNRITITALDILPKPNDLTRYYSLLEDEEAMEFCPLGVKQLLWKDNPTHFKEIVFPFIEKYTSDPQIEEQSHEINSPILPLKLKTRQEHPALMQVVNLIGEHVELYNIATDVLVELYSHYGLVVYCNLRFDLLMAFHRKKILPITSSDPIYNLVWILDASILKNSSFHERRLSLYQELRQWQPTFTGRNFAALGMVLRASFVVDWFARETYKLICGTNRPVMDLMPLLNLMEIGFSSRLTAKYNVRVNFSDDVPKAIEDMTICLRELISLIPSHLNPSDEIKRNILETMSIAADSNVYHMLRKSVYMDVKCNAIACSLLNQFLLDRFKNKDYVSMSVMLSVVRQLVQKAESEKQDVIQVWDSKPAPDFIYDKSKRLNLSFSRYQGILDPYHSLFRTLNHIYFQQPERSFELLSNKTAAQVIVWKFLVPLASVHAATQEAVLRLVIHIQGLLSSETSSSVQYYSGNISSLIEIVEGLVSNWGAGVKNLKADPTMFPTLYQTIADNMTNFGPEYHFGLNNAPITVKLLEFISANKLA